MVDDRELRFYRDIEDACERNGYAVVLAKSELDVEWMTLSKYIESMRGGDVADTFSLTFKRMAGM